MIDLDEHHSIASADLVLAIRPAHTENGKWIMVDPEWCIVMLEGAQDMRVNRSMAEVRETLEKHRHHNSSMVATCKSDGKGFVVEAITKHKDGTVSIRLVDAAPIEEGEAVSLSTPLDIPVPPLWSIKDGPGWDSC